MYALSIHSTQYMYRCSETILLPFDYFEFAGFFEISFRNHVTTQHTLYDQQCRHLLPPHIQGYAGGPDQAKSITRLTTKVNGAIISSKK